MLEWTGSLYGKTAVSGRRKGSGNNLNIRKYETADCRALAELFYETVHTVNAKDYTEEQLYAWADGEADLKKWDSSFRKHRTFVAVKGGHIIGFGDMDDNGYLDRLYVHKDFQRRGIASALCDKMEREVRAPRFTTHASITAKPFFERRGYKAVKEQQVERKGVLLTNYVMIKEKEEESC